LVELGFQPFQNAGINDILGGNGKNKGFEGFGFRFETESLVNRSKSRVSLGGDVEVNAGGSGFLIAWHAIYSRLLLVVEKGDSLRSVPDTRRNGGKLSESGRPALSPGESAFLSVI
jgi:hypothetical protein